MKWREKIHVYLWLIHVDGWQRPTQYCKAIIFQLKKKKYHRAKCGVQPRGRHRESSLLHKLILGFKNI